MRDGLLSVVNIAILSHLRGPRHTMKLLLSVDMFPGNARYRMGLINELAADVTEFEEILKLRIKALVDLDPIAVRLTTETDWAESSMPLAEASVMSKLLNSLLIIFGKIDAAAEHLKQSQNP